MSNDDISTLPTLADADTIAESSAETSPRTSGPLAALTGYSEGEVIGRGGMGVVVVARDKRLDREVAIKRMHGDGNHQLEARFFREARIQARLDHPAIVPVHELGHDATGRPFFAMKRVSGTTLATRIADPAVRLQPLLRALVDVCHAIARAHEHHIVHRDLKPANIMLGSYGEVYVLDWGVARLLDDPAPDESAAHPPPESPTGTAYGAVLGTPGYMAPEQLRGEPVDIRADIYSLGCILFEILTRSPLHPRDSAMESTINDPCRSPSSVTEVAPELDRLCARALAEPADQRPTARELAEQIQHYLDGDRDLEERRRVADQAFARAQQAFAAGDRTGALRAAGTAVGLDPRSPAAQLITRILVSPPPESEFPPALRDQLMRDEFEIGMGNWRSSRLFTLIIFAFLPVMIIQGVRQWSVVIAFYGVLGVMVWLAQRARVRLSVPELWVAIIGYSLAQGLLTRVLSPMIIVPTLAAVTAGSFAALPIIRPRWAPIAVGTLLSFLLPLALELSGVLERTWWLAAGELVVHSRALDFDATTTTALLVVANLSVIIATAFFVSGHSARIMAIQRRARVQTWQLEQLYPLTAPS